jgi:hypothetical protein
MRAVRADTALFPHLGDAITKLTNEWEWEAVGDDVADVVAACKEIVESWYSDMLIGSVFPWIITPPAGWLLLDGSTHANADYPELTALLPAHLISGANFTLPDVTDAFPFGVVDEDNGAAVAGSNTLTLSVAQLPSHSHLYVPPALTIPVGPPPATPVGGIGTPTQTGLTGSGDDIDKRPRRFGLIYAVYAGRE